VEGEFVAPFIARILWTVPTSQVSHGSVQVNPLARGRPASAPGEFAFDVADFADELAAAETNLTVGSRLLHEDDVVRVWDITLGPGERLPFHRHRATYLYRCHTGSLTCVRFPDGRGVVYRSEPDEVHVHEIGPADVVIHDLENAGETPLSFTTIELLR
jgi:hypothetical protein